MNTPLITIVVPVYKVPEKLLYKCLNSIAAQTSSNFEAILVDDGSPDNCGEICDKYAEEYSCFKVIHQKNGGLSVVRNNGINNASGDWVCFVDGDDWIEPETVSFAEEYIAKCGDGDVLIWDEFYDMPKSSRKNYFLGVKIDQPVCFSGETKQELYDLILPIKYKNNPEIYADIGTCNARIYNTTFLKDNKLLNVPGLKRMQDNVFNLYVIEKADKIYYCCKHLYHYNFNEDAATKKYAADICGSMKAACKCMIEFSEQTNQTAQFKQRIYTRFARVFLKIIELKHANKNNPSPFSKRIQEMKEDFSDSLFSEIVDNVDLNDQDARVKIVIVLLREKAYILLYFFVKVIVSSRNIRYQIKGIGANLI